LEVTLPSQPGRITEAEIGLAVLQILAEAPDGTADVESIKADIPDYVTLSPQDKAASPTRPGEELWEQQVRNLASHKEALSNIFAEGFAQIVSKGVWAITEVGRLHLRHRGQA
jgi:hypothetical protein